MHEKKIISIFGATGSIGESAFQILTRYPDPFRVLGLTAYNNVERLIEQAKILRPEIAVIGNPLYYERLKEGLEGLPIKVMAGEDALCEVARLPTDVALIAVVGMAALNPTWAALEGTQTLALANKECIVAAGPLILERAQKNKVKILPVDSEHNALFQLLENRAKEEISHLVITASGGPFRGLKREMLTHVTVDQALRHPNWQMGPKNTIDSATLMNKGLELIEAAFLFDFPPHQVDAWVHPQSIVHALLYLQDGSMLMQASRPTMQSSIGHAFMWPQRLEKIVDCYKTSDLLSLTFEPVDHETFPAIKVARECLENGLSSCLAFNTANEEAVEAFIQGRISFLNVMSVVQEVVSALPAEPLTSFESIIAFERFVRKVTQEMFEKNQVSQSAGGLQWNH